MAIVSFDEVEGARTASQDADSTTATRLFRVVTDSFSTSEYDVLTTGSAPLIGDVFPDNPFLRVETKTSAQISGQPLNWILTVNYSTSVPEDKDEVIEDPPSRPPDVSITQLKSTEPVHNVEDFFNRDPLKTRLSLRNSAGVTYDPAIEREITDIAIVVGQNFLDFRPNDILGFRGAVNSEVWETFDRGTARIVNISYERTTENGVTFWRRMVEIHVREKTADYNFDTIYPWQVIRENIGVQQLTTQGTAPEPIIFADGGNVFEPISLNQFGRQQAPLADPSFERWDIYPQKDFADLDIRLT